MLIWALYHIVNPGDDRVGVLTGADRHNVEMAAYLMAEYRKNPAEMQTSRLTLLNRMLCQYGMTPSNRAKLSIPKARDEDPFANLKKWR